MERIRKALAIVGLLLIAVGLAIFGVYYAGTLTLRENLQETMIRIALVVGGAGALLTLIGFRAQGFGPNLKYYISYGLTSIFVLGCLVMIYMIARNHSQALDVTEERMHLLHPRTVEFLRDLDHDIEIAAFPPPDNRRDIEQILERYARSSSRVHYTVYDLYKDVTAAKKFGERITPGDIFIWTGTRRDGDTPGSPDFREKKLNALLLRDLQESKLTNAIVEVMRPQKVAVYFLQGHGEVDLKAAGGGMFGAPPENRLSYSKVQQLLQDEMFFQVKTLEIPTLGFVPDDCSLLICAGPTADLLPMEAEAIRKYLEAGGRALFLLDPNERPRVRFDQWERLMAHFGVKIQNDLVLEHGPLFQVFGDMRMLLVNRFGRHPTVENQSEFVQMAIVRTVAVRENLSTSLTATELMYSSSRSWSEDMERWRRMREVELPESGEIKPQCLAVAVTLEAGGGESDKGMRMVVIGDSDVFEDHLFTRASEGLFSNAVNWLTAREDLIDIPPKRLTDTPIFPSSGEMRLVFTVLVLASPGIIFFGGLGYVLVRRRVR